MLSATSFESCCQSTPELSHRTAKKCCHLSSFMLSICHLSVTLLQHCQQSVVPVLVSVSDVRVLYNSDFSFSQRLYGVLDVDLCRVKLHEPLRLVVQQSLLYVRDMVPKPCFLALTRLEEVS